MAFSVLSGLGLCLALMLSGQLADVRALRCHSKLEYDCTGSACDRILSDLSSGGIETVEECGFNANMCGLTNGEISGSINIVFVRKEFSLKLSGAGCVMSETSGCSDISQSELGQYFSVIKTGMDILSLIPGFSLEPRNVEVCSCEGNLCNSAVKYNIGISVVIVSIIFSFIF